MKDGITLHPEHGLNPSIEVCMICGEENGDYICVMLRNIVFKFFRTSKK